MARNVEKPQALNRKTTKHEGGAFLYLFLRQEDRERERERESSLPKMPLTPRFDIKQNSTEVWIHVHVPNIRINNDSMEILLTDNCTLHFYASPYLLKLNFSPNEFIDTDAEDGVVSAQYDPSQQKVKIPLQKKHPSDDPWPNLELTGRLLEPTEIPTKWLHSVTDCNGDGEVAPVGDDDDDDQVQDLPDSAFTETTIESSEDGYGFGNMYTHLFIDYYRSGLAIESLQLPASVSPETTSQIERRALREAKEQEDFDLERYITDYYTIEEDYLYPMVMDYVPFWKQPQQQEVVDSQSSFTSEEQLQLSTIPYPLLPDKFVSCQERECFGLTVGLLDFVVPFVYDHITTMGDSTVESAWTISILSSSLSWLDPPTNLAGDIDEDTIVQDTVKALCRRMLTYPYWRNWKFAIQIWKHAIQILEEGGIHQILRCLLKTRQILDKSECYYLGNKLYIDPFLYWVQKNATASTFQKSISKLVQGLRNTFVEEDSSQLRNQIGLGNLIQLERDAIGDDGDNESSSEDASSGSEQSDSDDSSDGDDENDNDYDDPTPKNDPVSTQTETAVSNSLLDAEIGHGMSLLNIVDDDGKETDDDDIEDKNKNKTVVAAGAATHDTKTITDCCAEKPTTEPLIVEME